MNPDLKEDCVYLEWETETLSPEIGGSRDIFDAARKPYCEVDEMINGKCPSNCGRYNFAQSNENEED